VPEESSHPCARSRRYAQRVVSSSASSSRIPASSYLSCQYSTLTVIICTHVYHVGIMSVWYSQCDHMHHVITCTMCTIRSRRSGGLIFTEYFCLWAGATDRKGSPAVSCGSTRKVRAGEKRGEPFASTPF
jgi:hypothetical protein